MKRFIDYFFVLALLLALGLCVLVLCTLAFLFVFTGISVEPWRVAYLVVAVAAVAACLTVAARR